MGFWIWYPMWFSGFFLFGFRFPFDLSGKYAPPLILNAAKPMYDPLITTVSDR